VNGSEPDQASGQRRHGERRRLWDRRSPLQRRGGSDRRVRQRRGPGGVFRAERRGGADRRLAQRRVAAERRTDLGRRHGRRRRSTPTPYTSEELALLRTQAAGPGRITCPACGSGFTLGPARRRGSERVRRVACLGCGRAAVIPDTRAARVLVIAQTEAVRTALAAILAEAGHEVIEAADAGVGLAAYRTVPADAVFLDLLTPGRVSATDFLRILRREYPDARVVAIAGRHSFAGVDPLSVAKGLGATRALRIPLTREQVLQAVQDVRP